MQTGEKIKEKT